MERTTQGIKPKQRLPKGNVAQKNATENLANHLLQFHPNYAH